MASRWPPGSAGSDAHEPPPVAQDPVHHLLADISAPLNGTNKHEHSAITLPTLSRRVRGSHMLAGDGAVVELHKAATHAAHAQGQRCVNERVTVPAQAGLLYLLIVLDCTLPRLRGAFVREAKLAVRGKVSHGTLGREVGVAAHRSLAHRRRCLIEVAVDNTNVQVSVPPEGMATQDCRGVVGDPLPAHVRVGP